MPLNNLAGFVILKNNYDTYLADLAELELNGSVSDRTARNAMHVSTYYNDDGTVDHFVEDVLDRAYFKTPGGTFRLLSIKNSTLLRIAGTGFCEAANVQQIVQRIPFAVFNLFWHQKKSKYRGYGANWTVDNTLVRIRNNQDDNAYYHYKNSALFGLFMDTKITNRTANMLLH